jgi:hypothetical protein
MAELFYLGGVAFGLGLLIGFLLGTTVRRTATVVACGLALLATYVGVAVIVSADEPCHHCGNNLWFVVAAANGFAWLIGGLVGGAIRARTRAAQG